MRSSTFASFVALVASASAISITWPNTTDTNGTPRIDLSVSQTITWTSDSSDPATFKIELVSAPKDSTTNTAPAQTIDIASSVTTSDDKYVMPPPAGLIVNGTYQLFFYGAYNATTTGVIAESPFFIAAKVSGASATTSTGTGGSSPSPTSSTTTVTPSHKNAGATLRAFGFAGVLTGLATEGCIPYATAMHLASGVWRSAVTLGDNNYDNHNFDDAKQEMEPLNCAFFNA